MGGGGGSVALKFNISEVTFFYYAFHPIQSFHWNDGWKFQISQFEIV